MQGFEQIATSLGLPTVVLAVAGALRYVGTAADKEGRPDALHDAARVLTDRSWSRLFRPSAVILDVFNRTFGNKQFSWKCLRRSFAASLLFVLIFGCAFRSAIVGTIDVTIDMIAHNVSDLSPMTWLDLAKLFLTLIAPISAFFLVGDYISLWKSRVIVRFFDGSGMGLLLLAADLILSLALAFIVKVTIFEYGVAIGALNHQLFDMRNLLGQIIFADPEASALSLIARSNSIYNIGVVVEDYFLGLKLIVIDGRLVVLSQILVLSTVFTSLWAFLTLLAASVVKLLAPVQRFTTWFFDVEKHPFQAVGNVSAGLLLLGSLVWLVVRAAI